jgi:tetratricopeptide (TPR) repeat protein
MGYLSRHFRILLIVSLLSTPIWCQSKQQSSSSQASSLTPAASTGVPPEKATDPTQQAVIVEKQITKIAYQADGSNIREVALAAHVQSQAGVQQLAVLAFPYTSYNETVEFDYMRVRKPDDSVVNTPEYNIQDMPGEVTRQAPMYSDLHEKHVTVKGLQVGDTLEYLVRYRTLKPQFPDQFWFQYSFTKELIEKDEELEIAFPRDKFVNVESSSYPPKIEEKNGNKLYTWTTSNLALKTGKAAKQKTQTPFPDVQLTTFHSWAEVGRWYDQLQRPQLAVTPQIQAKAAELTKGLTTDDQKIRAIYDYVSTHIHYVSLSFGVGRYQPHAAEDVLENEYGDCKDKHTLLAALLKAAGYDAWPALINSSRKVNPKVPSPAEFDHVISFVPRKSATVWLDTTPGASPFGLILLGLRDKDALVIPESATASLQKTPAQPPFESMQLFQADGQLNKDGTFTSKMQLKLRGDNEVLYRIALRSFPAAQWDDLGQKISYASGFGGEVRAFQVSSLDDTSKPLELSYEYTKKSYGDWDNHRTLAPLPWFGLESFAIQEDKPEEPILLGAVGKLSFDSKMKLPQGFTPSYSSKVDVSEDFAEYHSRYTIENGILTASRELLIKKTEVPVDSWDRYKKFCKTLSDERDRYVDLQTGATYYPPGAGPDAGDSTEKGASAIASEQSAPETVNSLQAAMQAAAAKNPEAGKLMREGADAMNRRDVTGAMESFRKVADLDPKYVGVHTALAFAYFVQNNTDAGLRELRLEIDNHPEFPANYQFLAETLLRMRRTGELTDVYRKWLAADPSSRDAALGLAASLSQGQQTAEAIQVLEKAHMTAPDSPSLQYALGTTYLKNKQTAKGLDLIKKSLTSESGPGFLNQVAYSLADMNVGLDMAQEYGERSLRLAEANTVKAESEDYGYVASLMLGTIWDTVGWVYFRQGEYEKALPYVRAAWLLLQKDDIGDHLAQIYVKVGKKQEAARTYRLAYSLADHNYSSTASADVKKQILQHYKDLMGKDANPAVISISRRSDGTFTPLPTEELSRMRSFKLSGAAHDPGNAVFSIVFSPQKVEEVKYISGSQSFKGMEKQIAAMKFGVEFPDAGPARLYRRGMAVCEKVEGCNVVLLLPDSANVVDQAVTPN